MEMHALFLTVLAVILAYPLPRWLAQASFRIRSPWAAMVLWQAIALAGGLSMVGAPIVFGLAPFGDTVPKALGTAWTLLADGDFAALTDLDAKPVHVFSLCLGTLLGIHLLLTLLRTYVRVLAARRRHRNLVRLLSSPSEARGEATGTGAGTGAGMPEDADPDDARPDATSQEGPSAAPMGSRHPALLDDTLIIDHDTPLAYCLPGRGTADSVTVLSRGLLDQLSSGEIAAVIHHETTHLRQHHHLLTMAFDAWYRALPWLPTTRYGRHAVLELTEMLADDGALRDSSRAELLRSLATTAPNDPLAAPAKPPKRNRDFGGDSSDAADREAAQHTGMTGPRLRRLLEPPAQLSMAARAAVLALAVGLLAVPTALMLLPY